MEFWSPYGGYSMELKASIATVFRLVTVRRFPRVGVFEIHAERKVRAMILRGEMVISSLEGRLIHQMEVESRAWFPVMPPEALVSVRYALGCSGRGTGVEMAICAAGGTAKYQWQRNIEVCGRYGGSALMAALRTVSQVGLDLLAEADDRPGLLLNARAVADARRFLSFFLEALMVEGGRVRGRRRGRGKGRLQAKCEKLV
jgi:hypothetical protein